MYTVCIRAYTLDKWTDIEALIKVYFLLIIDIDCIIIIDIIVVTAVVVAVFLITTYHVFAVATAVVVDNQYCRIDYHNNPHY